MEPGSLHRKIAYIDLREAQCAQYLNIDCKSSEEDIMAEAGFLSSIGRTVLSGDQQKTPKPRDTKI